MNGEDDVYHGIRAHDLHTGERLGWIPIDGPACSAPVVAGGRLYVVTCDGILHAFE